MELYLNEKLGKITYETIETGDPKDPVLILAHGAGAGMHHPFLVHLANKITASGIRTIRFNFPYMEQGRKAPGSPKDAIFCWKQMIEEVNHLYPNCPLFISGKSYGGRMASHLLANNLHLSVEGIIYFGFPLHAPGRDSTDRAKHLSEITLPQLFIQGTKDKLANIDLIREVVTGIKRSELVEIAGGDHSFNVPASHSFSKEEVMDRLAEVASDWIKRVRME